MVVAPKSTLGNWMNEIRRFCPILRAVKFLGNPEERVSLFDLILIFRGFIDHTMLNVLSFIICCRDIYEKTCWLLGSLMYV